MKTKPTISAKINLIVIVFSLFSLLANTAHSQYPEQLKINPNYSSIAGSEIIISESYTLCNLDSTLTIFWKTQSEPTTTLYYIYKSTDNFTWEKIASIAGLGCGINEHTYSFIDSNKNISTTYYLLTIKTFYMTSNMSQLAVDTTIGPIAAPLCSEQIDYSFSVYPNPS